jgi:hypothetical protein
MGIFVSGFWIPFLPAQVVTLLFPALFRNLKEVLPCPIPLVHFYFLVEEILAFHQNVIQILSRT